MHQTKKETVRWYFILFFVSVRVRPGNKTLFVCFQSFVSMPTLSMGHNFLLETTQGNEKMAKNIYIWMWMWKYEIKSVQHPSIKNGSAQTIEFAHSLKKFNQCVYSFSVIHHLNFHWNKIKNVYGRTQNIPSLLSHTVKTKLKFKCVHFKIHQSFFKNQSKHYHKKLQFLFHSTFSSLFGLGYCEANGEPNV